MATPMTVTSVPNLVANVSRLFPADPRGPFPRGFAATPAAGIDSASLFIGARIYRRDATVLSPFGQHRCQRVERRVDVLDRAVKMRRQADDRPARRRDDPSLAHLRLDDM